jgi:hypothetical protein
MQALGCRLVADLHRKHVNAIEKLKADLGFSGNQL